MLIADALAHDDYDDDEHGQEHEDTAHGYGDHLEWLRRICSSTVEVRKGSSPFRLEPADGDIRRSLVIRRSDKLNWTKPTTFWWCSKATRSSPDRERCGSAEYRFKISDMAMPGLSLPVGRTRERWIIKPEQRENVMSTTARWTASTGLPVLMMAGRRRRASPLSLEILISGRLQEAY
ncbi:hypothetical protein GWI33_018122 [Rhynchophorus ferrugineus]|uniref:Uncharacterized protein n=1 Tax=Rhynchophorus ferrugineus TaxID=354439 RepID=A0A834HU07_RHYFE|nr:hypothetical protein GWI33_018122 [Rhynchophorus ferrugineus]